MELEAFENQVNDVIEKLRLEYALDEDERYVVIVNPKAYAELQSRLPKSSCEAVVQASGANQLPPSLEVQVIVDPNAPDYPCVLREKDTRIQFPELPPAGGLFSVKRN